jgi:hypothetical protein
MPSSRGRYLRFSLASVLLAVSVVGICLAPIVNRVHHQSRIIEAVERIGGVVQYLEVPPSAGTSWLRPWLDDDYFRTVDLILLQGCPATDELVADIARLQGVVQLNVCNTQITDESLRHIAGMRELQSLDIGFNKITNDGLFHLAPLDELRFLGLDVTEVTDNGLEAIRELPKLDRLQLYSNRITDEGAAKLGTMPWINELDLADTLVTNDGLEHLAKMPNLYALRLDQMKLGSGQEQRINDEGLKHLAAMPQLLYVSLANLAIADEGLARFKSEQPALNVTP